MRLQNYLCAILWWRKEDPWYSRGLAVCRRSASHTVVVLCWILDHLPVPCRGLYSLRRNCERSSRSLRLHLLLQAYINTHISVVCSSTQMPCFLIGVNGLTHGTCNFRNRSTDPRAFNAIAWSRRCHVFEINNRLVLDSIPIRGIVLL